MVLNINICDIYMISSILINSQIKKCIFIINQIFQKGSKSTIYFIFSMCWDPVYHLKSDEYKTPNFIKIKTLIGLWSLEFVSVCCIYTQTIIFCILAAVAVPVGTFTTIKCIKKLTSHPVNTLHRRPDIELVDYITPTQPPNSFQIDLENYNLPYIYPPSYRSGILPSYRSDILPLYENGYNIHCCLENEYMNIYFIIFSISIFLILYLFFKYVNFSPLINIKI